MDKEGQDGQMSLDNKHNFNTDTKGETVGHCDPSEVMQLGVSELGF